ncbi:unnamed protein product, partial [marine sediment metagenome]
TVRRGMFFSGIIKKIHPHDNLIKMHENIYKAINTGDCEKAKRYSDIHIRSSSFFKTKPVD